jgi:hypothetical protein
MTIQQKVAAVDRKTAAMITESADAIEDHVHELKGAIIALRRCRSESLALEPDDDLASSYLTDRIADHIVDLDAAYTRHETALRGAGVYLMDDEAEGAA